MPIVSGCPGDLDATGHKRWEVTKRFLEKDGGGWFDVYAPTLERYVRAWAMCDALTAEIEIMGHMVEGARSKVVNPLLAALDAASKRMDIAAQRLRLTPEARAKVAEAAKPPAGGGKFGGAFSDD